MNHNSFRVIQEKVEDTKRVRKGGKSMKGRQ